MQSADRLRNVENAAAMLTAPRPRGSWIEGFIRHVVGIGFRAWQER